MVQADLAGVCLRRHVRHDELEARNALFGLKLCALKTHKVGILKLMIINSVELKESLGNTWIYKSTF